MLIVGLCGTPKNARSNTRFLLQKALDAASSVISSDSSQVITTELIDLSQFNIRRCTGCDACVRKRPCPESEQDDMPKIEKELLRANGIIFAAPSYFTSVPGILKDLIDRSRTMKMQGHLLRDKVFGAITYAGLRHGGQEVVIDFLNRYALTQGMIVVGAVGDPVRDGPFGMGSMQTDDGKWRTSETDTMAIKSSEELGRRVAEVVLRLCSK